MSARVKTWMLMAISKLLNGTILAIGHGSRDWGTKGYKVAECSHWINRCLFRRLQEELAVSWWYISKGSIMYDLIRLLTRA